MVSVSLIGSALGIFCLLMVVLGYLGMRRTPGDMENYVLGGRKLGVVAGFFTTTATLFSAFSYFGIIGLFYTDGIGTWYLVANTAFMGLIIYFVGTRLWALGRQRGYLNVTEYLSDRYNSPAVGAVAGLIMCSGLLAYIGAQLRGVGITLQTISGGALPFWVGTLVLALVVTVYVAAGGFRGVVWTDVVQGVMMYALLLVAMFLTVYQVSGGFGNLMAEVQKVEPDLLSNPGPNGHFTGPLLLSSIFLFALANFTLPQMQQRFLSYRSHHTLKLIAVIIPLGTAWIYLCGFYIAMAGRISEPNIDNPEAIYPRLVVEYLPTSVALLALIAIVAATGSTANSIILTISSIATNEWYPRLSRLLGKEPGDENVRVRVTRLLLPVVVTGALLITFFGPSTIISLLTDVVFPAVAVVFPPVFAGLYWRRATAQGAVTSMLVGVAWVVAFGGGWVQVGFGGWHFGLIALAIETAALVVVSLATRPVEQSRVARFFTALDEEEKV